MTSEKNKGFISIDKEVCKGCYLCVSVCPLKLIGVSDKLNMKGFYPAEPRDAEDKKKGCIACTQCALTCPDVAIEVFRG